MTKSVQRSVQASSIAYSSPVDADFRLLRLGLEDGQVSTFNAITLHISTFKLEGLPFRKPFLHM